MGLKQLTCLNVKAIYTNKTIVQNTKYKDKGSPGNYENITQLWVKDHILTENVKRKSYTHRILIGQENRVTNMHALVLYSLLDSLIFSRSLCSVAGIASLLSHCMWNKGWARRKIRKKFIWLTPKRDRANFDTNFHSDSSGCSSCAEKCVCGLRCSANAL